MDEALKKTVQEYGELKRDEDLQQMSDADLRKQQVYWQAEYDRLMAGEQHEDHGDRMVVREMLYAIKREAKRRGIDVA